jgi:hypothetical protein
MILKKSNNTTADMVGNQHMRSVIRSVLPTIYLWRLADKIVFKSRYNMCLIVY